MNFYKTCLSKQCFLISLTLPQKVSEHFSLILKKKLHTDVNDNNNFLLL